MFNKINKNRFSVKIKILSIIFGAIVIMGTINLVRLVTKIQASSIESINNYKQDAYNAKQKELSNYIHMAHKTVNSYYQKTLKLKMQHEVKSYIDEQSSYLFSILNGQYNLYKDKLTTDELQQLLINTVQSTRYGKSGYFWINDFDYKMVMHPIKPKYSGKYFIDTPKIPFVQLGVDSLMKSNSSEEYIQYTFYSPSSKKYMFKSSIVKVFKPFNWIIGTGAYIDEVNTDMKKQALESIEKMRYGQNGYFWINDTNYMMLMHPIKPKLNDTNIKDLKDPVGNYIFHKINKVANSNNGDGGTVEYYWEKPGSNIPQPKMSYVMEFKPWNWIIGTGVYIDDIDNAISKMKIETQNRVNNTILESLFLFFIILIITLYIANIMTKRVILNPLEKVQDGLKSFFLFLQNETDNVKDITILTNDEFGQMANHINRGVKISSNLHDKIQDLNDNLELRITEKTLDLEESKKELEAIFTHTRESIEYASLIQGAVVSQSHEMKTFFKDHFSMWTPKDTVGGDIWLFNELRHKDECLLFFIDCTGHGVPGAFVTMIVKSIEREIILNIKKDKKLNISPATILGQFNKIMKVLLKQETKDSISNVGWDGGIIYYNKRTQILKFAGAETPLFYMTKDGEFNTIKGNRYSVGYKKCSMDYEYKETIMEVEEGMKFWCTTDGYLDQNGGEKDFPFGKKRFGNIIKENHKKTMGEQKDIFVNEMTKYESMIKDNDRNDDITMIAFEIDQKSTFTPDNIKEIVRYKGIITQNVIAVAMDNIENKVKEVNFLSPISTITIEYCQNMMNYSKNEDISSRQIVPAGEIIVDLVNDEYYELMATNIISIDDKEKIEPKLIEIQGLDRIGIKRRYKELRKSGQNTHEKGGGIGMYEIAKVSDSIEYRFKRINEDKYYFTMKSIVTIKKQKSL